MLVDDIIEVSDIKDTLQPQIAPDSMAPNTGNIMGILSVVVGILTFIIVMIIGIAMGKSIADVPHALPIAKDVKVAITKKTDGNISMGIEFPRSSAKYCPVCTSFLSKLPRVQAKIKTMIAGSIIFIPLRVISGIFFILNLLIIR